MVKLIPEINKKIWKILKKLNLTPKESPKDFIKRTKRTKHRYSTVCQDEKGKKYIFYARLHDSPYEKNRMKIEIKIARVLRKKNYSFFAKYYKAKIEKDFEWILREYFEESPLESKKEIEKLSRPLSEKEIEEICKSLLKMQKIKISEFRFLKKKKIKNFVLLPKELEKKRVLKKKEIEKIKELVVKNEKILRAENKYFCHGDFHIGNLIFKDGKLKIIDLESAMISNFAYDICFLWSRLWKERVRRKILAKFYSLLPKRKKEKFKILFRLNALLLGFSSYCAKPKEYSKEILKKRKSFYLNLMKKALKGFETLLKI